jgi:hypothetical protein
MVAAASRSAWTASVGKLGLDERSGVRNLRGGAKGGDLGGGDAKVEGLLGRGGDGAKDDDLVVGGGGCSVGLNAGGAGVGDGAVDGVTLEAEDDEVLLGDEELVEGDVDEHGIEGYRGQARVVVRHTTFSERQRPEAAKIGRQLWSC